MRTPSRETFGHAIIAVARHLGTPLMPWQEQGALVGGEIDGDTGLPAYRNVVFTVPRQSGKTTLLLSWQIQRARGWERLGPQRIVYSAQTGNDARKKLIEDQIPILEPRKAMLGIRQLLKGMGNEAVVFRNGSRMVLLASLEKSGHGKTVDLAVKDELFADQDDRRDQALVPAMARRPHGQVLTASTMGTSVSIPWNRTVERGRAAVLAGKRSGTAYFEWSAEEDADPDDPRVWWGCMPALGLGITEAVVADARETLTLPEFRRAFLNITDGGHFDPIIPAEAWAACRDSKSVPVGQPSFALDVSPDRAWSSIVVAANSGRGGIHIEITGDEDVVDHRPGTDWLVDRAVELQQKWGGRFAIAKGSPAWSLQEDLEAAKVDLLPIVTEEHSQACGDFYDAVADRKLRHIDQAELNAAVAGAERKFYSGDAWLWSRRMSSVDISPLVAATLAHWVASKRRRKPQIL